MERGSVPSFGEMTEFLYGTVGALFGGGVVYGRMTSKLESLQQSQEASQAEAQTKREETARAIETMRADLKQEMQNMHNDLKEDVREIRGIVLQRARA